MSEVKKQMRDVLQELYTCGCSVIDALDDSDLIDADSVERFEDALHEAKAALSHPVPDVPGAEEVEAIRKRHKWELDGSYMDHAGDEAHRDRATLLKEHDRQQYAIQIKNSQIEELEELLDAAREELREVREAARPFATFEAAIRPSYESHRDTDEFYRYNETGLTLGHFRRLAAALKEKP